LTVSYNEELTDIRELLSQGFSDKNRLRELERNIAVLEGEVAELTSTIASTEVAIGEARLQILQQEKEFHNAVVSELREVQTSINDGVERAIALEDVVSRTIVRAPDAGIVNGLQVHTIAGVITPGMRILDIVPQEDDLIIEAQVSPIDIDRVAVGQEATILFSSFGMGTAPSVYGKVTSVSADSIIDQFSGVPSYLARVEVSQESIDALADLSLMPGMPADVFIATGSRTLMQYIFKPLSNSVAKSLRED
jgi:epimerase transport system membrane fusion protein